MSARPDEATLDESAEQATYQGATMAIEAAVDRPLDTVAAAGAEAVHWQPTVAPGPGARRQTLVEARPATAHLTNATSPLEALAQEEVARTKVFLRLVILTALAAVGAVLTTDGDRLAARAVMVGCAVVVAAATWLLLSSRRQLTFTPRKLAVGSTLIVLCAFVGVYYWGIASPATAMVLYGIYFFSLSGHARLMITLFILCAVVHAALALLIVTGTIVDRGLVQASRLSVADQLVLLAVVEFLYAIAFVTARASRRTTVDAIHRLEQAVRQVAQREALLAEAKQELDRALKIGGPGRYTEQVIGTFRLGALLGRGGMGEVYEAQSMTGGAAAAVKLIHASALEDAVQRERFLREARTMQRIQARNVVSVFEVGTTAGEMPYIAMERLHGSDLAMLLRKRRRLGLDEVAVLGAQLALGLDAARLLDVVHRDLKPHNVFHVDADGTWKILDFGVAKAGSSGTLTQGHVVGTPGYMAPEQARGEDVDHRADVYSLAAILYRCATGQPAFVGNDVPTMLYEVVYKVPAQPSSITPLPFDVDRVLAIGLAKRADDRLATSLELATWFAAAAGPGLSDVQRQHADELIARQPWSARLDR